MISHRHLFLYYTIVIPPMYPFGHFAVAYFIVYFLGRYVREDYSLPVVLVASVLPDLDVLFSRFIVHRGPTHSVVTMSVLFVVFYVVFRRGVLYYVALLSHSLIGDYFTAYGIQLFWPMSYRWYRAPSSLLLTGRELIVVEFGLFVLMIIHIFVVRRKNM